MRLNWTSLYGSLNRWRIQFQRKLHGQNVLEHDKPTKTFSPSDLITFMESPFASAMDSYALSNPGMKKLMDSPDALLTSLQSRGNKHEQDVILKLELDGHDVFNIESCTKKEMLESTILAMREGKDMITNGYLSYEQFSGFTDILAKVPGDSLFGSYHYEVWDVKLSKQLKPYFAIQICCYVEIGFHN